MIHRIQRIQSLFLAFVGLISIPGAFLVEDWDNILFACIGTLAFVTIFCYKNRLLQIRLTYLNIVINLLLIGLAVFYLLTSSGGFIPEKGVEILVCILLIALLLMVNKYIQKDIDLIKSVDRLR